MRTPRVLSIAALTAAAVTASPPAARADIGLGIFLGDPTGLDLKIDMARRSSLDIVLGFNTFRDGRGDYGHLTYLVTPFIGWGRSVAVPLRIGIGVAVFDDGGRFGDGIDVGVRAPFEVGLMFRSAPIEIYGEIAILIPFIRDVHADLQGGIGFRIYF
jgi:hypothetical protein